MSWVLREELEFSYFIKGWEENQTFQRDSTWAKIYC